MPSKYIILNTFKGQGGALGYSEETGPMFCHRDCEPLHGYSLYEIVHTGIGKNRKPYSFVKPVRVLGGCAPLAEMIYSGRTSEYCQDLYRLAVRYDTDIYEMDDLLYLIEQYGIDDVCEAARKPLDCSNVDFEIARLPITCGITKSVLIDYVNGESEFVPASFIYSNKDRLVNAVITVYGTNVDNMYMKFEYA